MEWRGEELRRAAKLYEEVAAVVEEGLPHLGGYWETLAILRIAAGKVGVGG